LGVTGAAGAAGAPPPAMPLLRAALLLLAHNAVVPPAGAWRTHGVLFAPKEGTRKKYAGKFCFDFDKQRGVGGHAASLEVEIRSTAHDRSTQTQKLLPTFPVAPGGLYLAFFGDDHLHWTAVRKDWDSLNCEQFLLRANAVRAVTPALPSGYFSATVNITESTRPRFLYFAFVFCNMSSRAINPPIKYKIHAMNLDLGFEKEFSMDGAGVLKVHWFAVLFFVGLLGALYWEAHFYYGESALWSRPLLRLLLISCGCSALGNFLLGVHNVVYAWDGEGLGAVQILGELSNCLAKVILSTLQLYIASGKALLTSHTEARRRTILKILVLGIFLVTLGCEVWGRYFGDLDWSTTLYFYESWPGTLILIFNTILFAEVCRATFKLIRLGDSSEAIQRFYTVTFTAAVLYFLAVPAMCLLAHYVNPWDRRKVVVRTEVTMRFTASAILALCLRPSRLDPMITARMEVPEQRAQAVELAGGLTGDPGSSKSATRSFPEGI